MNRAGLLLSVAASCLGMACARAASPSAPVKADAVSTDGTVTVGGAPIAYRATAGTIVVHPKDWDDAVKAFPADDLPKDKDKDDDAKSSPAASMFYVAYLKKGEPAEHRPLTFLFNGGPGSSSVWLHMGAFGPRRVVTRDDSHTPAAPYDLVDNAQSLLDASDLVFVDAPGTGFGRLAGKDNVKAFWGIDQDAHAFAVFITAFLSQYGRWNSPRYLFGESYGTTRAAVVANILESEMDVDLNGIVMLSQALNFDLGPDGASMNPGVDLPYVLTLPTYAATAWYHHKLDGVHPDLPSFLQEVEHFASTDYTLALGEGASLDGQRRDAIAARLHDYTGLPVAYIERANLRIDGGEFEQNLLLDDGATAGRLDSRFKGPVIDPLAKDAGYDPQSSAISSAYVSSFNDYVRRTLKYGEGRVYREEVEPKDWDFQHEPPGAGDKLPQAVNVMPDLAAALIYDPGLRVQLNTGYFDIATPYYAALYEMKHLPMPGRLQANIEVRQYMSGHMVYVHDESRVALHDNVADFIRRTSSPRPPRR